MRGTPRDLPADSASEEIARDDEGLETSEWGLDWGDISLIRAKLELTPTERLLAAQELVNAALRIRARNAAARG